MQGEKLRILGDYTVSNMDFMHQTNPLWASEVSLY